MRDIIVGHSFNKRNTSFGIFIAVVLIVVSFILVAKFLDSTDQIISKEKTNTERKPHKEQMATQTKTTEQVRKIEKSSSLSNEKILSMTFCRKILNNLPLDSSQSFKPGERVYFCTKIMHEVVPAQLKHVWINPNGKIISIIDMQAVNKPSNLWSYISLPAGSSGTWKVKVTQGEKVIGESLFMVD